ncbi:MAG: tRNA uridine-5-carboxymethylaminomethyl(34) synthesis GTPase MnmE [Rickettsia sp.]|nr:tRNA uridine-5-carboxymethylaminomethyl(34) synthesis GTPase MnmE [Rickettsia sp.]
MSKNFVKDTIFAKSSGFGKSGIAVFRISGIKAMSILEMLTKNTKVKDISPRETVLCNLYDPVENFIIDKAIVIFFKNPKSYTGEDMLEIHAHGSIAIEKMIFEILNKIPDVRIAEAGEFTKRAFINNKLDLLKVEAISDLIESETKEQHKQAIKQATGNLSELYRGWRNILMQIIFQIEAILDFPDEEIPPNIKNGIFDSIKQLRHKMEKHLVTANQGEILRTGVKLCIIGPPNAGKSSLMNFLLSRDVAITSDIAGTTRDIIEAHLDINGFPIILYDTAGIHSNPKDVIEKKGIQKALELISDVHIKILLIEYGDIDNIRYFKKIINNSDYILAISKNDLFKEENKIFEQEILNYSQKFLKISIKEKNTISRLIDTIGEKAAIIINNNSEPKISRARHKLEIEKSLLSVIKISHQDDLVLISEKIRIAKNHLSGIIGDITTEDILEKIFYNFCIGK